MTQPNRNHMNTTNSSTSKDGSTATTATANVTPQTSPTLRSRVAVSCDTPSLLSLQYNTLIDYRLLQGDQEPNNFASMSPELQRLHLRGILNEALDILADEDEDWF